MTNNTSSTAENYWEEQLSLSKFLTGKGFISHRGQTPVGIAIAVLPQYHEKIEAQDRYIRLLISMLTRQGVYLGGYPAVTGAVAEIDSVDRALDSLKCGSVAPLDPIQDTPDYSDVYQFVYDKQNGETPRWRKIGFVGQDENYIRGYDLEDNLKYKNFSIDRIIGGETRIYKNV